MNSPLVFSTLNFHIKSEESGKLTTPYVKLSQIRLLDNFALVSTCEHHGRRLYKVRCLTCSGILRWTSPYNFDLTHFTLNGCKELISGHLEQLAYARFKFRLLL